MSEALIKVSNLSKAYRIWNNPSARLKSVLLHGVKSLLPPLWERCTSAQSRYYRDFYALRDVSFELRRGEAVGIIGRNGSGKSTMLQIIAGTLQPSGGTVEVNGRVSALLELGSGFNPEFTGRENVYLNASILGIQEEETRRRFDEIAAFADIGDFIDQPVKTYSSGMLVRLAFAVSVCVRPDVLIVDEALSVGDVFFQQKCFQRIRELLDGGTSLLFVSHDAAAVRNLCDRVILLSKGDQVYCGDPEMAVSRYFSFSAANQTLSSGDGPSVSSRSAELRRLVVDYGIADLQLSQQHGARDVNIEYVALLDSQSQPSRCLQVGEKLRILLMLRANRDCGDLSSGIHLYDRMNNLIFAAGTRQLKAPFGDLKAGETCVVEFLLELNVHPGPYTLSVGCSQPSADGLNAGYVQHRIEGLGPLEVRAVEGTWPFYGMAKLPMTVQVHG
jgi:lipopolysaccharide transport system ATP-binding protein